MDELKIYQKEVVKQRRYGNGDVKEYVAIRWFAESPDGFDGTRNGCGYMSPETLRRAHRYYLKHGPNRHNDLYNQRQIELRKYLRRNPDVREVLNRYYSKEACNERMRAKVQGSVAHLIQTIEGTVVASKLQQEARELWNAIEESRPPY